LKPNFDWEAVPNRGNNPTQSQVSQQSDYLQDVEQGIQTLLTTREFIYYSYYARIKDRLQQYWEPKIKEKVQRLFQAGRTIASNGDRITQLIIVLDQKGILQKVKVIGESGVTDLDDAAIEAFRAAAPFPNPPKGIVEADGTIKIRWDFVLEA
jgi:protein TonB